ncbi:nucleotidyltransferase domain-containing protein [Salinivibrio kushneri]|uniref:nucleotidyltransferase domain-containing protein n=1 Tax=Salinivibrio kushneri TaxID=1908198 RepID=UPI0022B3AA1C|nr:nucleotidyltransferase domain-containing protein [Salinivibrio kushneri]WBA13404.1 nucleotidyltransferase domain-containing protein [Salinivibrio kushneri]
MSHDIYVFGSTCRGEATPTSDVDILVVPFGKIRSQYPHEWSVYSPEVIKEYFTKGRLFAWHLHLEAKCLYCYGDQPFLESLGQPAPYSTIAEDIDDLEALLKESLNELTAGTSNVVYELGIAHTAIRDIAMCASWAMLEQPSFSADAPYRLPVECPLELSIYRQIMLARHSSTRGVTIDFDPTYAARTVVETPLEKWVDSLREAI